MDYYRQEILDHYKYPRNYGTIKDPDIEVLATNASCGDKIKLQIKVNKKTNKVLEIKYLCQGCAISTAASSLLSEYAKDKPLESLLQLTIDDITKLLGAHINIGRIKCATLGLNALKKGINKII